MCLGGSVGCAWLRTSERTSGLALSAATPADHSASGTARRSCAKHVRTASTAAPSQSASPPTCGWLGLVGVAGPGRVRVEGQGSASGLGLLGHGKGLGEGEGERERG